MNDEMMNALEAASREFQDFVGQVSRAAANPAALPGVVSGLGRIGFRLKHVSKCLAAAPQPFEKGSTDDAVLTYCENLQALKASVEILRSKLLAERARLEKVRGNLKVARAWATSVRETS